jgi:hypothetical protein
MFWIFLMFSGLAIVFVGVDLAKNCLRCTG